MRISSGFGGAQHSFLSIASHTPSEWLKTSIFIRFQQKFRIMTIAHTMSLIFHGLKIPLFKVYLRQSTALYLSLSGSLSKERDCTISGANQPRIALIINAWINKRYNSLLLCSMANYSMVMLKLESLRPYRNNFWHFD